MTRRLLDYDPLTGVETWFDYDHASDKTMITTQQSAAVVNDIVDQAAVLRNDSEYSKAGIKNDKWHYARVPNGVILDIKAKYGLDMLAPKPDWKSILRVLNTDYPYLKVTAGTHA